MLPLPGIFREAEGAYLLLQSQLPPLPRAHSSGRLHSPSAPGSLAGSAVTSLGIWPSVPGLVRPAHSPWLGLVPQSAPSCGQTKRHHLLYQLTRRGGSWHRMDLSRGPGHLAALGNTASCISHVMRGRLPP